MARADFSHSYPSQWTWQFLSIQTKCMVKRLFIDIDALTLFRNVLVKFNHCLSPHSILYTPAPLSLQTCVATCSNAQLLALSYQKVSSKTWLAKGEYMSLHGYRVKRRSLGDNGGPQHANLCKPHLISYLFPAPPLSCGHPNLQAAPPLPPGIPAARSHVPHGWGKIEARSEGKH